MTWDEFKKVVDTKLAEQGKNGAIVIRYIDISSMTSEAAWDWIHVNVDESKLLGLAITD